MKFPGEKSNKITSSWNDKPKKGTGESKEEIKDRKKERKVRKKERKKREKERKKRKKERMATGEMVTEFLFILWKGAGACSGLCTNLALKM